MADRTLGHDQPDSAADTQNSNPFERIVEEAGYAIYVTDPDGTITYVNPAFEDITGYTADEAIGQTPAILDSGEETEGYFERLWETITAGEVWDEEITNCRKDGTRYVAYQTIAPIKENGEITHFVASQTDITERKDRQEALERNRNVLAQTEQMAGVGGWELTLNTEELRWTDGTRRIHEVADDYDPSLADAIEFFHPEDRDRVKRAVEQCRKSGISYDIEARLITAEGRTRWVHAVGERDERGETPVLHGAISDISARKQREERLMVLNRVLRHNLRNDLNVITGSADQLQDELADLDLSTDSETGDLSNTIEQIGDRAQNELQRIEETAHELSELAEKARDVEQSFDHDQITGSVELRPLFEEVKSTYQGGFPDATIEIVGENVAVQGNREGLRKIVEELLENALKHSDQESPHVTLRAEKRDADRVTISVADTGPGLPEMERKTIEQGAETSLMHGSGIGLWLVNWLVTQLGGTIRIEDNDPRGTLVRIKLPAASPTDSPNAGGES